MDARWRVLADLCVPVQCTDDQSLSNRMLVCAHPQVQQSPESKNTLRDYFPRGTRVCFPGKIIMEGASYFRSELCGDSCLSPDMLSPDILSTNARTHAHCLVCVLPSDAGTCTNATCVVSHATFSDFQSPCMERCAYDGDWYAPAAPATSVCCI